jgi:hypothetical protein
MPGGGFSLSAKLHLLSRVPDEHDELACDPPRDLMAKIFLGERKRRIGRNR